MQTRLQLDSVFEVQNIKVRVEGSKVENTQQPAIDLKLAGSAPAATLPSILGCGLDDVRPFWLKSSDGRIPAFPHMKEIKSGVHFDNCDVVISGKRKFQAAKVDSFSVRIRDENVIDLTFRLSLVGLKDESSGYLCSLFHDSIDLEINSAQLDMLEDIENGS